MSALPASLRELDHKDLSVVEKAIRGMYKPLGPEARAELAEIVLHHAREGKDERTRVRAAMVATAMVAQGIKVGLAVADEGKSSLPGVTVNITNAQVTVAPSAMTSFLADCTPAVPTSQVIEHRPDSPAEQSPS